MDYLTDANKNLETYLLGTPRYGIGRITRMAGAARTIPNGARDVQPGYRAYIEASSCGRVWRQSKTPGG